MKTARLLTKGELNLLFILADGKGHPSYEIEKNLQIDKGNLSKMVKKLERDGWIYRTEKMRYSAGSRARKLEYPLYIQKDKFPLIVGEIDRLIEILREEAKLKDLKMSEEEKSHERLYTDNGTRYALKFLTYLNWTEWVETPLYKLELQKMYQKYGFNNREDFIKWQEESLDP